jgi:hypothetical protein
VPGAFVVLAAARFHNPLRAPEWMALGLYIMLAMVLNYEVLGKSRFQMFLSYHPFGIAMILLFGLIVAARNETSPIVIRNHNESIKVPL